MISVIIPVHQEEERIDTLLRSISTFPDTQIIVVDGAPDCGTIDAIKDKPVLKLSSLPGRGIQMNHGAALATGEILLFLHADTILPARAPEFIEQALRDPHISGGAFRLRYDTPDPWLSTIAFLANIRSQCTRVPYGDQALFVRAKIFRELGGFAPIAIMEDIDFMTRMRRAGHAIRILDAPVLTSARRQKREGLIYCTGRNLLLRILYHLGMSPDRLAKLYRPHQNQNVHAHLR